MAQPTPRSLLTKAKAENRPVAVRIGDLTIGASGTVTVEAIHPKGPNVVLKPAKGDPRTYPVGEVRSVTLFPPIVEVPGTRERRSVAV